jgi:transporter family protein
MEAWLIFALISAITAALVAIFGKIGLKGIDSTTATAIRAVIMALFLIGVILIQNKISQVNTILQNKEAMTFIILSGIMGALSWIAYFLALSSGKASQVAPIDRLSVVFVIILAAIFLGEKINIQTGIGTLLVAAGAIIIAMG